MATVSVSINAILEVSAFSMSPADRAGIQNTFNPQIILDGKVVGSRSATVQLEQGSSHRIEFAAPESNLYYFDGPVPSSIEFTIPANSTGESYSTSFTGRIKQQTSRLTVTAIYDPPLPEGVTPAKIIIQGGNPLNRDGIILQNSPTGVTTGELVFPPGQYSIFFEEIQNSQIQYSKPDPVSVILRPGARVSETRQYQGISLPSVYWLKPIAPSNQKIMALESSVGMFSNNISNLTTFFSSSINSDSEEYCTLVYQKELTELDSAVQLNLAYGHSQGSGSLDQGGQVNDTATRAIYGQYRNVILGSPNEKFNLSGKSTDHFYAISFPRARKQNMLDSDAFELNIAHLSGSQFIAGPSYMAAHTGSNVRLSGTGAVLRLITDSKSSVTGSITTAGLEYNIISGSIENGIYNAQAPHYYGKLYRNLGLILLDADKLDMSASFGTVTSREVKGLNQLKLFTAISGAAQYMSTTSTDYLGMKARGIAQEISHYYFIDVRGKEFNFTNNPTYTNTQNEIIGDSETKSKVYITTIGLYDEQRNLVAIAKTSKPEKKSYTEEVVYNVKLKL